MSRHPVEDSIESRRKDHRGIYFISFQTSVPSAITLEDVQVVTTKDKAIQTVIELCTTGHWHKCDKYDIDQNTLR